VYNARSDVARLRRCIPTPASSRLPAQEEIAQFETTSSEDPFPGSNTTITGSHPPVGISTATPRGLPPYTGASGTFRLGSVPTTGEPDVSRRLGRVARNLAEDLVDTRPLPRAVMPVV